MTRQGSTQLYILAFLVLFGSILLDPVAGAVPQFHSLVRAARFFSLLGDGLMLLAFTAIIYLFGLNLKGTDLRRTGSDAFVSLLASTVTVHILKAVFERPRPSHAEGAIRHLLENPSLFDLTGRFNSFPSGHTATSFAVAYAIGARYPALRPALYSVACLIGASRVYLGSHYPSDVAFGALLGIGVAYLFIRGLRVPGRRLLAGLMLLTVSMTFFKTGGFLLFDVDEAVFSEASREMVETGDYVTPTYNYEPRYDKPILIYWFMSAAFGLFGVNEFAARFTSSAFGAILVLMTFFFVRRVRGPTPAYLSSAVLLLNLEYFVYTHSAVTDMTLCFFISASLYAFYLAVTERDWKWWALSWAASALAVLTKGAVGLLFPGGAAIIYLLATGNIRELKHGLKPYYLALFLAVAMPWFLAEYYVNGREFFDAFIIKHHIKRYSGVISSHSGPFYYYVLVLLAGFFPWVALLPGGLYGAFKDLRNRSSGLLPFSAVWFLFVFVFFSASSTKLPNYIFPLFPAAAIIAGLCLAGIIEKRGVTGKSGLYIMTALSFIIGAAMYALPFFGLEMDVYFPAMFFNTLGGIFVAIGIFSIAGLFRPLISTIAIMCSVVILLVFLRLEAIPPANAFLQKDLYTYSKYARSLGGETVLTAYEINRPSLAFYAGGMVRKIEKNTTCDIPEYSKRGTLLVITGKERYPELAEYKGLTVIDERGQYMLLSNRPDLPPVDGAR